MFQHFVIRVATIPIRRSVMFSLAVKVVFFQLPAEHCRDMAMWLIVYGFVMAFVNRLDAVAAIHLVDLMAEFEPKCHYAVAIDDETVRVSIKYLKLKLKMKTKWLERLQ